MCHSPTPACPAASPRAGWSGPCALALALLAGGQTATAAEPAVNLTVQIRDVPAGDSVESGAAAAAPEASRRGFSLSTLDAVASPSQVVNVSLLNGTRGVLRIERSEPFQWVQAAQAWPAGHAPKAAASRPGAGGGVVSALGWSETGHAVALTVHWPGGRRPAWVDIVFDSASPAESSGSALPDTERQHAQTTLAVPLGQWVTFAKIGGGAAETAGTWSTSTLRGATQRWWQLKILAP